VSFQLFGPLRTDFINYVRTVEVIYDGKWEFILGGTEQQFEEPEAYKGRRVQDRFTSEMLERYCQALGVDAFNPDAYGPEAVFFESNVPIAPNGYVMTLPEVQAWLEIVPGMAKDLPG
jgi:hypothetical protein